MDMKKIPPIDNFEISREDIALLGLIFLGFISLLHTSRMGMYIVIPVVAVLIALVLEENIKGIFKKNKKE